MLNEGAVECTQFGAALGAFAAEFGFADEQVGENAEDGEGEKRG